MVRTFWCGAIPVVVEARARAATSAPGSGSVREPPLHACESGAGREWRPSLLPARAAGARSRHLSAVYMVVLGAVSASLAASAGALEAAEAVASQSYLGRGGASEDFRAATLKIPGGNSRPSLTLETDDFTTNVIDSKRFKRTCRWWFMGGGAWDNLLPWLNESFTRQAVQLVSAHRASMTGVYMFLPLSVQQRGTANVASVVSDDELIASIVPRFVELGLTVSIAIWVDPRLMATGAAIAAVPNLTAAAVRHNLTGIFIDYEVGNMGGESMASNYSAFLKSLCTSMHSAGREVEMALDKGGILREYSRYAATGVDRMMTMATYNGFHVEPRFGAAGIARLTEVIDAELNASVSRSQLAVGVGSMIVGENADGSGTPCSDPATGINWNYQWTEAGLRNFVDWLQKRQIAHLDIYRCDMHLLNSTTEPWYYNITTKFLRGEPVVRQTPSPLLQRD